MENEIIIQNPKNMSRNEITRLIGEMELNSIKNFTKLLKEIYVQEYELRIKNNL